VSDLEKRQGTLACPRCKAPMKEVVRIAPVQSDPGLIAYECPSCGYVTSVLISPKDGEAGSGSPP
jgi:transposase-like protein